MQDDQPQGPRAQDRRVLRSRSALFAAAVRLVSERATTAIPVADLADAADVSRRVVYLHFADGDSLLVEAAVDLIRRELIPQAEDGAGPFERVLAVARHFAEHRPFYRTMLTGPCAFALTRTLNSLFGSLNRDEVRELFGEVDEATADDLSAFVAAGTGAIVHEWLIDGADPLDPAGLAGRLTRLGSAFAGGHPSAVILPVRQPGP
jgi:AcrR family transcriptional regulator